MPGFARHFFLLLQGFTDIALGYSETLILLLIADGDIPHGFAGKIYCYA